MIHVDSSFLIDLMREQRRGAAGPATRFLQTHSDQLMGAAVFVACELEAGAARAAQPDQERARLRALFQAIAVVYPDERFAPAYGDLLDRISAGGRSVGVMDLLIATCAVVEGARLVTGNARHFSVIPDLQLLAYH